MFHKIEKALFAYDKVWHRLYAALFLPFSVLYCVVGVLKKAFSKPQKFDIPVISVGNLTVGGSGKTPFIIALCAEFESPCVVLRGYGRNSKGLFVVSKFGEILCDVRTAGDEATLIAKSAQNAVVIVSEDRKSGIKKAIELGCKVVLLDDGFGKFDIDKFDILLKPKIPLKNSFCLPSGPYRYPLFFENFAHISAIDGVDFERHTSVEKDMRYVLITAISNPARLDSYLPPSVEAKYYFADHHFFTKNEIDKIMQKHSGATVLCTQKDAVKLDEIGVEYEPIFLKVVFEERFLNFLKTAFIGHFGDIALKNQTT